MRKALLTLALLLPAAAFAQETVDEGTSFGARATVEADAKLAKGLHLTAHEEFRWYSSDEDVLRFYSGIGLEYKVLPFLKVGAEYEYINRLKHLTDTKKDVSVVEEDEWSVRHRGNFFLTGTWKTTDWQFGLKETFRMTNRPGDMNTLQAPRNALSLKHKASVKYLGWDSVVPFAAFEVRNTLNFHVEGMIADGDDVPQWLRNGDYEFEYHLDAAALLQMCAPYASIAAISRVSGINQHQLSHYANGIKKPRPEQRRRIVEGLHKIGRELIAVE